MSNQKRKGLSRRGFLGASVGVVAAGIGGACQPEEGGGAGGTGGTTASGGASTGGQATGGSGTGGTGSTNNPLVSMVRGTDWAQATMDAIAAVGGLPDLTGKTVVIRPNVIEAQADGTTSPEVIRGVIRAAKAKGASTILVAEDSFNGNCLTMMQTLGITAVCTAEGATPTNLNGGATTNYKPANATAWGSGIDFYNTVYNAGYVINVPKCKTHGIANFSLAFKAWFGCLIRNDIHTSLANKAAEAHLVRKEDFIVIDATRCMVSGGPGAGGTMKDSKIVLASKDAIAADVTGLAIIRYFGGSDAATSVANTIPWQQAMIRRAMALAIPGWLTAQADFAYTQTGISEAAAIMAKRTA
jgi:uncharacterized protein (DUF362 family)